MATQIPADVRAFDPSRTMLLLMVAHTTGRPQLCFLPGGQLAAMMYLDGDELMCWQPKGVPSLAWDAIDGAHEVRR